VLYRVALDRALPVEDESLRKMTAFVLGNIVASLEPLSIAAWTQLLANSKGMGGRKFETVVKRLGSVLNRVLAVFDFFTLPSENS